MSPIKRAFLWVFLSGPLGVFFIPLHSETAREAEYKKIVKKYRKKEKEYVITILSHFHAKVLFDDLLKIAKKKKEQVCIYSGTLNEDFYNQLADSVKSALERTEVLVAVSKSEDLENNLFAQAVKGSPNGKLKTVHESLLGAGWPHFILVGDKRYRIEKDDVTKQAIACFNDPTLGKVLLSAKRRLFPEESQEQQAASRN